MKLRLIAAFSMALGTFLSLGSFASAHPFNYGAIKTYLDVHGSRIDLYTEAPGVNYYYQNLARGNLDEDSRYFSSKLLIQNQSMPCALSMTSTGNAAHNQIFFKGTFNCQAPASNLSDLKIHNQLFLEYFANIDSFMYLKEQNQHLNLLFTQTARDYPKSATILPSNAIGRFIDSARQFVWIGIKHIWTGYDHILFLLSIVLLLKSVKQIIILVTAFTIAHSTTLILASLRVITISPRIVEPLIALTILYTALRNSQVLYRSKSKFKVNIRERQITTGSFGLIHGLGFAGALLATNIPNDYFIPSLLFFNVGIEIGQLTVLLIFVPLLFLIYRSKYKREVLFGISVSVAALAAFWFMQRIFFI